jgi:hypothetical protein
MNEPIKLYRSDLKRVDIANVVSLSFFNNVPLHANLSWTSPWAGGIRSSAARAATLVDRKKYDFGFGNPVGFSNAYLGVGFYKKNPASAIGVFQTWDRLIFAVRRTAAFSPRRRQKQDPLRISIVKGSYK